MSVHLDIVQRLAALDLPWQARPFPAVQGLAVDEVAATFLGVLGPDGDRAAAAAAADGHDDGPPPPLPAAFDWRRTGLSACVGPVEDQGKCGSCWAVASVTSLADRRCIRENTAYRETGSPLAPRIALSSLDVIACDKLCEGLVKCCRGCTGGYPRLAFEFFTKPAGVVSAECMPYNLSKSLLCPLPKCRAPLSDTPYKAKSVKQVYGGVPGMGNEIMRHGPVAATFTVYEDFMAYAGGVYNYSGVGKRLGLHAVKVLGWGQNETTGQEWWECQNSWGKSWGVNGTFRIQTEQCGFEESVFTATPCVEGEICV